MKITRTEGREKSNHINFPWKIDFGGNNQFFTENALIELFTELQKVVSENDLLHSVMPIFQAQKNWTEDYEHENGNYICKCSKCKEFFIGYKRRAICKECANEEIKDFVKDISKKAAKRIEIEEALIKFIKHYDEFRFQVYSKIEWTPERIAETAYKTYFKDIIQ